MKFFNKVKEAFKGFVDKIKNVPKGIIDTVRKVIEKIKPGVQNEKKKIIEKVKIEPDYKERIEKFIMGLKDDYAIYGRKPNGQFYVYLYNVEDLKWETLDILDQMKTATLDQFNEIQAIVKKVVESAPSDKTEDDYKDMFANINAVLKGGSYIMKTLGPVSTDGTPFEGMDK